MFERKEGRSSKHLLEAAVLLMEEVVAVLEEVGAGWLHALVKVKAIGQISRRRCCSGIGSQQKARCLKHGGCDGIGKVA